MKPIYLERISKTISHKENVLALSIICECGSNNFDLLNYQFNGNMKMEEKEATKKIKKDFGSSFNLEMQDELYIVKRFFGFVIKKRKFSDYSPKKVFYEYLTAQCKHCGERFVLFDQERAIAGKEPGPMPENLEINKKNLTD